MMAFYAITFFSLITYLTFASSIQSAFDGVWYKKSSHFRKSGEAVANIDELRQVFVRDIYRQSLLGLQKSNLTTTSRYLISPADFDELNDLLSKIYISVPSLELDSTSFGEIDDSNIPFNATISNLYCDGFGVGGFQIFAPSSPTTFNNSIGMYELDVDLSILPNVEVECNFSYVLNLQILNSEINIDGEGNLQLVDSSLETSYSFVSEDLNIFYPNSILRRCIPILELGNFDLMSTNPSLDSIIETLLAALLQVFAEPVICDLVDDLVKDLIGFINDLLGSYEDSCIHDQLSAQNEFVAPDESIVDFTERGSVASFIFDTVSSFFASTEETSNFLDILFEGNDSLLFSFSFPLVEEDNDIFHGFSIDIDSVSVSGLDGIQNLTLSPIAPQTINANLHLRSLTLTIHFSLAITEPMEYDQDSIIYSSSSFQENFSLDLELTDLRLSLSLFLAFSQKRVNEIVLGSIFDSSQILSCLQDALFKPGNVTQALVSFESIRDVSVRNLISPGVDEFFTNATGIILDLYENFLITAFPLIIDDFLVDALNKAFAINSTCHNSGIVMEETFIDFRDLILPPREAIALGGSGLQQYGDISSLLFDALLSFLSLPGPESGFPTINEILVQPLITSLAMTDEDDSFSIARDLSLLESELISLKVIDLYLTNLIISAFEVLIPNVEDPTFLGNKFLIGDTNRTPTISLEFILMISAAPVDVRLEMIFDPLKTNFDLLAEIDVDFFLTFPLENIVNINCLVALFSGSGSVFSPGLRFADVDLSFDFIKLNFDCLSCSKDVNNDINRRFAGENNADGIADFGELVLDTISSLLVSDTFQEIMNDFILASSEACPRRDIIYSNSDNSFDEPLHLLTQDGDSHTDIAIFLVVLGFATGLGLAIVVRKCRKGYNTPDNNRDENNVLQRGMISSKELSVFQRYIVPFTIAMCIGFFLSGHISPAGIFQADIQLATTDVSIELYNFSGVQATIDLWENGAKMASTTLMVLAICWPYVKQLITLWFWCVSSNYISHKERGAWLRRIGRLSKWSALDVFFLVCALSFQRLTITNPDGVFPPDFFVLNLLLVLNWGIYANMIAQLVTNFSSHYILHLHEKSTAVSKDNSEGFSRLCRSSESSILLFSEFHLYSENETYHRYKCRNCLSFGVGLLGLLSALMLIFGSINSIADVKISGLVALLTDFNDYISRSTEFTFFDLIRVLMEQAQYEGSISSWIGLIALVMFFVLTAFVFPLLQTFIVMLMCYVSLTDLKKERLYKSFRVVQAWNFCEVFAVCIILLVNNISHISQNLLRSTCEEPLSDLLELLGELNLTQQADNRCFYLEMSFGSGYFMFLSSSIMIYFLGELVGNIMELHLYPTKSYSRWNIYLQTSIFTEKA